MPEENKFKKLEYGCLELGGPRHLYRERLIINFLEEAKSEGVILDAGCGDGSLSIALAKNGFKVMSMDSAAGCVKMLNEKIKKNGLANNVDCRQGDITKLDYPEGFFDGIVCGEVLEHVPDDKAAVVEFKRVLKKGGVCVISVPTNPKMWDIGDEIAGHVRRYKKEEIISLFQNNGFAVEKIRFWGFLLMWLYHKTVFLPWVKITNNSSSERSGNILTKIGQNSLVSSLIANIFKIDSLFSWLPSGMGAVLRARKV